MERSADVLLYTANDSWFGDSIGTDLHFMHARVRALETGRPVLRVGNVGVTAWIDPKGRVHHPTALGQQIAWVHDVEISEKSAPYLQWRKKFLWVLFLISGAGIATVFFRYQRFARSPQN